MARTETRPLDTGLSFPEMTFERLKGGSLNLPKDLGSGFGIVLFYRGQW